MTDFFRVIQVPAGWLCTVFSLTCSQKLVAILAFSCHDQWRPFSHVCTMYTGVHTDTFKISIHSPKTDSKGCTNEHHTFRDEWIGLCKHYELKSSECWTPLKVRNLALSLVDIKIKMREREKGEKNEVLTLWQCYQYHHPHQSGKSSLQRRASCIRDAQSFEVN